MPLKRNYTSYFTEESVGAAMYLELAGMEFYTNLEKFKEKTKEVTHYRTRGDNFWKRIVRRIVVSRVVGQSPSKVHPSTLERFSPTCYKIFTRKFKSVKKFYEEINAGKPPPFGPRLICYVR